jgi:hypothetical protein
VDLVAEVTSIVDYYKLADRLNGCGFTQSSDAEHICRWNKGSLILDVMPSEESVLGHSTNRWYPHAIKAAERHILGSGLQILMINAPLFLATKLEAFYGRANGDYAHHDMEDIINVIDGRPEIIEEVAGAPEEVREYIRSEFDELLADESFVDEIPAHFRPDSVSQARVPIVVSRMTKLAGM